MFKWLYLSILIFVQSFLLSTEHSIVFVHLGPKLPSYASIAFSQARLFNPGCPIVLIASQSVLDDLSRCNPELDVTYVSCEGLNRTKEHELFLKRSTLDKVSREGFWSHASERFLYLYDYMLQYNAKSVFHLEYDNMLYVNLEEILPTLLKEYKGIAATFDNDKRCIPGIIYIANSEVMGELAKCFSGFARKGYNDMEVIARFSLRDKENRIDFLPIIMPEYVDDVLLESQAGHVVRKKERYSQYAKQLGSLFDAAAIGQYLGGIDPRNGDSSPGFINESAVINPSLLSYEWKLDDRGRKVPYVSFNNASYRMNNLHIHSKNLEKFSSIESEKIK